MAEENPIRKALDIASNLAKAAWNSRLKKYFVYSVGIHAALLTVLSIGGIIGLARGASQGDESARTTAAPEESDEPPASPTSGRDDTAPTGDSQDYFRRAGIDTTPPRPEETPDSPDDILDELLRPGRR